jgi:hypothetical protein
MGEFEDQMFRQSQANPLSGFVTAGAAKLMTDRTIASSNVIKGLSHSLQMLDGEPKPTFEQIEDLKSDSDAVDVTAKLTDTANKYKSFLDNINNQKELYGNVYDDALTKLAIIGGDEAGRLSGVLQGRKEDNQRRLEGIKNLPLEKMKFAGIVLNHDIAENEYERMLRDQKLFTQAQDATEWISGLDSFKKLPPGKVSTWSGAQISVFQDFEKEVLEKGKGKYDPTALLMGIQQARAYIGNALNVKDVSPQELYYRNLSNRDKVKREQDTQALIKSYQYRFAVLSNLRGQENFSNEVLEAARNKELGNADWNVYANDSKGADVTVDDEVLAKELESQVNYYLASYGKAGEMNKVKSFLSVNDPGWLGEPSETNPNWRRSEDGLGFVPKDANSPYINIRFYKGFDTSVPLYNPVDWENKNGKLQKKVQELNQINIPKQEQSFFGNVQDAVINELGRIFRGEDKTIFEFKGDKSE